MKVWYTYASTIVIAVLTVIFTVRYLVIKHKSKAIEETGK